jgi:hypothetical protein
MSLEGQYTEYTVSDGIKQFIRLIDLLEAIQIKKNIYITPAIFLMKAVSGAHLNSTLKKISGLEMLFTYNVIKKAVQWPEIQQQENSAKYSYKIIDYSGSTIAEHAERKLQLKAYKSLLLNFSNSSFDSPIIQILKNSTESISLDSLCDEEGVLIWLSKNGYYDNDSIVVPRDNQTILQDISLFEKTSFTNHRRTLYRRKNFRQLWVVDNLHTGKNAHLEVFDEVTKRHLGESPINQISIDEEKKDSTKRIRNT